MPDKTPAEKLRLKPGMSAAFLHLPDSMKERLGVPDDLAEVDDPGSADFVLDFAATQADAEDHLTALGASVRPGTVIWMAYPKGSKAAGYDVNRDTIWRFGDTVGLIINANVAIDETYSAVRMKRA